MRNLFKVIRNLLPKKTKYNKREILEIISSDIHNIDLSCIRTEEKVIERQVQLKDGSWVDYFVNLDIEFNPYLDPEYHNVVERTITSMEVILWTEDGSEIHHDISYDELYKALRELEINY